MGGSGGRGTTSGSRVLGRGSPHGQGPTLGQAERWAGNQVAQRPEYLGGLRPGWHYGTKTVPVPESTGLWGFREGKQTQGW